MFISVSFRWYFNCADTVTQTHRTYWPKYRRVHEIREAI